MFKNTSTGPWQSYSRVTKDYQDVKEYQYRSLTELSSGPWGLTRCLRIPVLVSDRVIVGSLKIHKMFKNTSTGPWQSYSRVPKESQDV